MSHARLGANAIASSAEAVASPARTLKAITEPTWLPLLCLVAAHEEGGAWVCDLIELFGLSQSVASRTWRSSSGRACPPATSVRSGWAGSFRGGARGAQRLVHTKTRGTAVTSSVN